MFSVALALICASLWSRSAEAALGALKLDNYTFDKFLQIGAHAGQSVLVKFDQSYGYGQKEDEFKALCKLSHSVAQFFIAEVPVQEYGDKENDDLRERFSLQKEDFPAYVLFNDKNTGGLRYSGEVKADELAVWLRKNQVKMPVIGTIGEMDELAKQFFASKLADEHVAAARKLAEGEYSGDSKALVYVKIMEKIKDKGAEYVGTELARVTAITEGKVTPEKKAQMNEKLKILNIFAAARDEL